MMRFEMNDGKHVDNLNLNIRQSEENIQVVA